MDPEAYFLVKAIHILSSTILFGTGIGTAFHMWFAHLKHDAAVMSVVARNVVLADWLFTAPAGLLQPITGLILINILGLEPLSSGLIAVYFLYTVATVCWIRVVFLQYRVRDLAEASMQTGSVLPQAYYQAMREWFVLGWPAFFSLLAIYWLMFSRFNWY